MDIYRGDRVKVKERWGTVIESERSGVAWWLSWNTRYATFNADNVLIVRFPFGGERDIDKSLIKEIDRVPLVVGDRVSIWEPITAIGKHNSQQMIGEVTNNVTPAHPTAIVNFRLLSDCSGFTGPMAKIDGCAPLTSVIEIFRKEQR